MAGEGSHTLKLRDAEPTLPGLALPEAFEGLDRRVEASIKLCKLSTPPDTHVLSVIGLCQELQRLLKCSFIENGILASRLEMLVQYQEETLKKMDKRMVSLDLEQKVTRKNMKRLRKRVSAQDMIQRKKREHWWDVSVRSSDYDSFSMLSRMSGSPDLEFVLRVNQLLIDFVADEERTELLLPPMGQDERAEVSKLASIYKIRCRYGKSTQVASSTLIKARQTCIPGHGDVDAILDGFARAHQLKRTFGGAEEMAAEEGKGDTASQGEGSECVTGKGSSNSPPVSAIPSTMLTPLSSLTSASIDMSGSSVSLTPVPSPPTSGMATPTSEQLLVKARRDSYDRSGTKSRSRCSSQSSSSENPLPNQPPRSMGAIGGASVNTPLVSSGNKATTIGVLGGISPGASGGGILPSLTSLSLPPHTKLSMGSQRSSQQQPHPHHSVLSAGHLAQSSGTLVGNMILQQQHHQHQHQQQQQQHLTASIRPLNQPTVVASPLKIPVSQLPQSVQHNLTTLGVAGGVAGVGSSGGGEMKGGVAVSKGGGASSSGEGETKGSAREVGGAGAPVGVAIVAGDASPPKRTRLSRKAAVSNVSNTDNFGN